METLIPHPIPPDTITKRPSAERGHAIHSWLESRHTFSFGEYHHPDHMGFRSLRVINEDLVAPGMGFGTHPHRDMEIFSYILEGALEHKDSMGNGRALLPGQIQLMSAGTGVTHSEFNPSRAKRLHFLQIWIHPRQKGLPPSYTEWHPGSENDQAAKRLVISADGREGSATIHQDADVWRVRPQSGESISHELRPGRGLWLQVVRGSLTFCGMDLEAGDAASCETPGVVEIRAGSNGSEGLLFDLV